jgi:hypothetical protein
MLSPLIVILPQLFFLLGLLLLLFQPINVVLAVLDGLVELGNIADVLIKAVVNFFSFLQIIERFLIFACIPSLSSLLVHVIVFPHQLIAFLSVVNDLIGPIIIAELAMGLTGPGQGDQSQNNSGQLFYCFTFHNRLQRSMNESVLEAIFN